MAITWTYDAEQLASSDLFRVRRVIGDTNVSDPAKTAYFSDQEIAYAILAGGNESLAVVSLLRQLATIYADRATVATGAQRINLSDISKRYEALASMRLGEYEDAVNGSTGMGYISTVVVDGYSSHIASDEVCDLDPELGLGRVERSIEGTW